MTRIRLGAAALAVAAVLFLLYPAARPWRDESTLAGATQAMASPAWVATHLFAMIGFILVPLGLLAVRAAVSDTRSEPLALAAAVTMWFGAGLTLPFYGLEAYGLNALAMKASGGLDLLDLAEAMRYQPAAVTTFGIGLVLLAIGGILATVAIWRSGALPRYSGVAFGAGFALFLPQFYTPPASRIAHGVLMAVGLSWLAFALWTSGRARTSPLGISKN